MPLVDYSGSESSGEEERSPAKEPKKPKATSNKPIFQKVVDSSNPHKIRVSLQEPSDVNPATDESERPLKRAKLGSSGLSGFNSFLPAPKRGVAGAKDGNPVNSPRKGGLGAGVSLRTGAAPGFSREPEPSIEGVGNGDDDGSMPNVSDLQNGQHISESSGTRKLLFSPEEPVEEPRPKGKMTMFKPLSVARKPPKKKLSPSDGASSLKAQITATPQPSKPAPKVSLFSTAEPHEIANDSGTKGAYQPMVYHAKDPATIVSTANPYTDQVLDEPADGIAIPDPSAKAQQSLDIIASDLNLSASAKRQLFGRQKNNPAAINIVNFNTDEEYKANEAARQSGEQIQHNPVRAIAPGKHSLKQLVNMGTNQADALEESFASGRRNRSEAGSKYGW